jgi:LPXTG-motif cell wall-anchored protein
VANGIVNTASVTSSAAGGVTVADTDSVRVTVEGGGSLPATGSDIADVLTLALLTLLAGLALLVVRHHRHPTP